MTLEVRLPISATPSLLNRVNVIAHSILTLEPDSIIRVTVGDGANSAAELYSRCPWSRKLPIDWVVLPPEEIARWAQTNNRFAGTICERMKPPFGAENVLLLDADVVGVSDFSDILDDLSNPLSDAPEPSIDIAAVMAHVGPFGPDSNRTWAQLFNRFGVVQQPLIHTLTGFPFMTPAQFSPAYFNTGVVFAKASALEAMADDYFSSLDFMLGNLNSYFFDQIAFTIALLKGDLFYKILPITYNFPNDPSFDEHYYSDLARIKLLHFLRQGAVDRERDFESLDAIKGMVARELTGSNKVFAERVRELLPLIELDLSP